MKALTPDRPALFKTSVAEKLVNVGDCCDTDMQWANIFGGDMSFNAEIGASRPMSRKFGFKVKNAQSTLSWLGMEAGYLLSSSPQHQL